MPGLYEFPPQEHLTRKRDYLDVYAHGRKLVGRAFVCYLVRREGQGRQVGLTVSRKVGKAVVRNRVKRYLREAYRLHRPELVDDVHLVFVARPACAAYDFSQCREAVRGLLQEGGLLNG